MIRSNLGRSSARALTPPAPEAVARIDEILKKTAGVWDNEEGSEIIRTIRETFDTVETEEPGADFRS